MKLTLTIFTACCLFSCSNGPEKQTTTVLTEEKPDSTHSKITIPISIEESEIANMDYDPATDPENKKLYKIFEPYISTEFLHVENVTGNPDSVECFMNYLGTIYDLENNTEFHVVSQFCTIQAADAKHGNSKVAFLNRELEYARVYHLEAPEELPISIEQNSLIFDFAGTKKGIQFNGGLPAMLCIPDSGCYE
ncbi:MAG: hypothetical protein HYZ14_06010 [Bacteroidetes bacterium]|nr:hypothetical protein [Bacteroidota bacterium]